MENRRGRRRAASGKSVFYLSMVRWHAFFQQAAAARGGQPVCSQIDNRALLHRRRRLHTARWPRLSNLALSAICRLCSFKQLALKQRFHRHEVYLPPSVCSLHVAFPISRPTFEDSFRSKASWYSTSLAIKFSFIII